MRYALKHSVRIHDSFFNGYGTTEDINEAVLVDHIGAAYSQLVVAGGSPAGFRPVAVEEIPGETKREVVELEGVVDLTGLKYTLTGEYTPDRFFKSAWNGQGNRHGPFPLQDVPLYDTLSEAFKKVGNSHLIVVGIRETTTAPKRIVRELVPAQGGCCNG